MELIFKVDKLSREILVNWLCKLDRQHFAVLHEGLYNWIAIFEDENQSLEEQLQDDQGANPVPFHHAQQQFNINRRSL